MHQRIGIRLSLAATSICALLLISRFSFGQDDDKRRSELGERQRLVERNMAELESRFVRVAEALQAKEPERAKRLIDTLQQAKERLIAKRMANVTTLLDSGKLDQADEELKLVIEDLERLVRMLLNDDRDAMTKSQEIETLEQWKKQIQSIAQEQNQVSRETQKTANKEEALKGIDEKIKLVEQLVKDQQDLLDQSQQSANSGIRALDRIADKQFELRQRTEAVARDLRGAPPQPEQTKSNPTEKPEPSAADNKSGDKPPSGDEPPANQPPDANSNSNPKPEDPNAKSQPSDSQPGANSNPSEGSSSGDSKPSAKRQPGQAPLENSLQHQQRAEEHLTQGQPTDAQRDQQKSLGEMQAALEELNRERRRIASLPPEALAELAKEQRRTRGKTMDLAKQMESAKRPSSDDNPDGKPAQQPGQQPVREAEQAMDNAAGGLEEKDGQRAERQQAKSEEKLDEALREIEERLNQLREETRQEKLARLEARFSEMLNRQRATTQSTIELDDKKTNLSRLQQRDQLNVLRMASEETEISELGHQAYDLLLEDGTSSVFPECVLDLREDLQRVSQLLESERTDQLTQFVQREIETALEDLMESLKQAKKDGGGGGGGGGGGKQPLLRKSAELKMLRAAQMRVNRSTKQFESIRGNGDLDQALESEIHKIGDRQGEISEMAGQLLEKDN